MYGLYVIFSFTLATVPVAFKFRRTSPCMCVLAPIGFVLTSKVSYSSFRDTSCAAAIACSAAEKQCRPDAVVEQIKPTVPDIAANMKCALRQQCYSSDGC